jgi:hypothetical protein
MSEFSAPIDPRVEKLDDLRIMVDAAFKRRSSEQLTPITSPENPVASVIKEKIAAGETPDKIYFTFGKPQARNEVRVDNPQDFKDLLYVTFNKAIDVRKQYCGANSLEYNPPTPQQIDELVKNKFDHELAHAERAMQCPSISRVEYGVTISQTSPELNISITPHVVLEGRANAFDVVEIFNAPDDPSVSDKAQAGGFTTEQLNELVDSQKSSAVKRSM